MTKSIVQGVDHAPLLPSLLLRVPGRGPPGPGRGAPLRRRRDDGAFTADEVVAVEGVEQEGWPFPVPGLITDLVLSMDDRFLYFSNWLTATCASTTSPTPRTRG